MKHFRRLTAVAGMVQDKAVGSRAGGTVSGSVHLAKNRRFQIHTEAIRERAEALMGRAWSLTNPDWGAARYE
jgi:hypothetical protein